MATPTSTTTTTISPLSPLTSLKPNLPKSLSLPSSHPRLPSLSSRRSFRAHSRSDDILRLFERDYSGYQSEEDTVDESGLGGGGGGEVAFDEEDDAFDNEADRPEGYNEAGLVGDIEEEEKDKMMKGYERIYGPVFSGKSFYGGDVYCMDAIVNKNFSEFGDDDDIILEKPDDGFEESIVEVRRVTKVTKGGKNLNFRAVVVVGNRAGIVGVGVGKALDIADACEKATFDARRNLVKVPLTRSNSVPHRVDAKYSAAVVMIRPAVAGTGVCAGGAVRIVLEAAGVENALGKQLGSYNALNNARATIQAFKRMKSAEQYAEERGIPMEQMWQ